MSKVDAADDLENLSNVDLRARCVEYGLPNVPITDTSRKLLIRRLRVAMDGGGDANAKSAAKGKSRRETINVVAKVVEPAVDTSPKKGRTVTSRRTIGGAETAATKEPSVELSVSSIPQRRRSGRMTPVPPAEPVITATVKRKATIIDEESDEEEDDDDVQIVDYDRPQIARASRSPSLSKSKTVTTSYQHIQAHEPIREEPSYVPRETVIPVRLESAYQLPKPTIVTTHYERESSSYLPRPSTGQLSRPSLASSNYTTQHATNSQTRRYTTSGGYNKTPIDYTPSANLGYRTQVNEYLHSSENSEDNADEDDDENLDAPYLSDFARRLSRLKAEPLIDSSGTGSLKRDSSSQLRESQRYYTTSIGGRRGIAKHDSLGDSFRQFWVAIDRKYGLRKYLAVIAIVLVVIFVYIFFLQQN